MTEKRRMVGPNETGEICARGPQIAMGCLGNPTATAESFDKEGFLHTGDVGHIDENGLIHIEDRVKEMIKVRDHRSRPQSWRICCSPTNSSQIVPWLGSRMIMPARDRKRLWCSSRAWHPVRKWEERCCGMCKREKCAISGWRRLSLWRISREIPLRNC